MEIPTPPPLRFTDPMIRSLKSGEIFVFGSNLDGRHGKGAAKTAQQKFGARHGVAEGLTGQSYALPTVGKHLSRMPIEDIGHHIKRFLDFALSRPDLTFLVTEVGCGLAGHHVDKIGPFFANVINNASLSHVILPRAFHRQSNNPEWCHGCNPDLCSGCGPLPK